MPSLTEFKTPYDFKGLHGLYNLDRYDRWSRPDSMAVANVWNQAFERGPDFSDLGSPLYREPASGLNGHGIITFTTNEGMIEASGSSIQQDQSGRKDDFIHWMYESPLLFMVVMRKTGSFDADRGWWGYGSTLDGYGLRTNISSQFEFEYEQTDGARNTTILTKTPTIDQWEICMCHWDGGINGSIRVGITQFYEDAQVIDLSVNGLDPDGGDGAGYPGTQWQIGRFGGSYMNAGDAAMWGFWVAEPNEKGWDGLLRWAGTKYGITLS